MLKYGSCVTRGTEGGRRVWALMIREHAVNAAMKKDLFMRKKIMDQIE